MKNTKTHSRTSAANLLLLLTLIASGRAEALKYESSEIGGQSISIEANTNVTAGAAWRMEERSGDLVGKSNLNPDVCNRVNGLLYWQGCQGLFREQSFPAAHLAQAPGQFGTNADDGNLNYNKHDLVQAPFKITTDIKATWGNWGLFTRGLFFYDFVNNDFTQYHPNRVTSSNYLAVANVSTPGTELLRGPGLGALPVTTFGVRNDSRPCGSRNPNPGQPCGLVYIKGGTVYDKRSDSETLREIGTDLQLLDLYAYGTVAMPWGKDLTIKLGRQGVSWGESTLLFFNSINQINPINANNFFRVGSALDEAFRPVGMLFLGSPLFEGASLEGFYQYEWVGAEAPPPGSFYSTADVGTDNNGKTLNLGFGNAMEDPEQLAYLLDNPLSGTTATSGAINRLPDRKPPDGGQYGLSFKYFADWLNNGTELDTYFMNYHARLPYVSFISAPHGCAFNTTSTLTFLQRDCPDVPLSHARLDPNNPKGATDDVTQFDKIKFFLDYPKNIKMLGFSFSTTVGPISMQGEVAYRPREPLQVDLVDLAFMAYGPAIGLCHEQAAGCSGSDKGNIAGLPAPLAGLLTTVQTQLPPLLGADPTRVFGLGVQPDGSIGQYGTSDFVVDAKGTPGSYNDTFDLIIGHGAGSGRLFPSFIAPYRGYALGHNPPSSYIRGWEYFDTYQFNLGGTYIMGATHPVTTSIGGDQIIMLFETGATWVPDLPPLDVLQLAAPGVDTHASAGADGSGADRSRQACSTNAACSYGPDGLRFNPHQQDRELYPDKLSYGYDIITAIKYESVLPGISLAPLIVWKHDVGGTAPGLATNFIQGRKIADVGIETRYKSQFSFNLGYQWITGGGRANTLHDRDTARVFAKYQF